MSGYSIYALNDYKRCVCDGFASGDDSCLVPVDESGNDNSNDVDLNGCDDGSDDPWSCHDFIDQTNGYYVEDGIIYGIDEATNRRVMAARGLPGELSDYLTRDNVVRIQSILS